MAVGLGSTFEEVIKKINSCGDVTVAGNNTFTGNNTFKGDIKFGNNAGFGVLAPASGGLRGEENNSMQFDFYKSQILFKDSRHSNYGTTLQANMAVGYGTTNAIVTLPAKTCSLAAAEDLDKKQPLLVSGTNIKTINGQSILGEGDLEISGGGGSGGSNGGAYAHLVSFGFYRTDDSDIAGCGSIMIPSASAAAIVGTSVDNLKTFLAKFNGKFYPMAIKTDGYTTTPYTGIFVNPTNNSLNVVASASSGGNAEFTIDVYDITETVVQTSTGGGGGSGSNEPVLISVASTNSYRIDPLDQLSQHNIRVRVISGTLQAGDRLEICRPIAKKAYNLVNGVKKNVRWKQKLKACAYKILTETDIANIAAGKNILVLTVNHSSNTPNKGLYYTCTSDNNGYGATAPRTIRIVRPTPYGQNGIMQNIQISNSVYVTRSYGSNVIKGM